MLSAQHLVKAFAGRRVIEEVTLQLERGEVVGLLGPNGAGKTTTFQMLTGMIRPDAGVIVLDGHNVTAMPFYDRARFGIAYLPQAPFVPRGLTVEQNIRLVLEARLADDAARKAKMDDLLAEFRLGDLRARRWAICRAGSAGAAKSPSRSPASPASPCWTNLSRASIPMPPKRSAR